MAHWDDESGYDFDAWDRAPDPKEGRARDEIRAFVAGNRGRVFYPRQLQVLFEDTYFHWVTHRAVQDLVADGFLLSEERFLNTGGRVRMLWHSKDRNVRRQITRATELIEEYSHPDVSESLGWTGESLVLEGFARSRFVLEGRDTKAYGGRVWTRTGHDLDFIFSRDGFSYGVEVKNKLGYIDDAEFATKIDLCRHLELRPIFACRMLPRTWINALREQGGFALIFKWHLYPLALRGLARRVKAETGMLSDAPGRLADGTMQRVLNWHDKLLVENRSHIIY